MKKILAIVLAVMMTMAILTACEGEAGGSSSKASESATEKATEAVTEAATEAITEAPTEAPTEEPTEAATEAPTEIPQALQNDFVYTDPAGVYQVTVPDMWNDTGKIIEGDYEGNEAIEFAYKEAYNQGAGHVFTIITVTDSSKIIDISQWPHAEELYNDGNMQIFVNYPTDLQFAVYSQPGTDEFNKQQAEYGALKNTTQEILDSFTLL